MLQIPIESQRKVLNSVQLIKPALLLKVKSNALRTVTASRLKVQNSVQLTPIGSIPKVSRTVL